jgi:hypothetical protein
MEAVKDYKKLENQYGKMYHLLLDKVTEESGVRFVHGTDYPKFAGVEYNPIFFDENKNFRVAVDYIIVYPKIYVRTSIPVVKNHLPIIRCYLQ